MSVSYGELKTKNPDYWIEYYKRNCECIKANQRQWSKDNPDYHRNWRAKNADKLKAYRVKNRDKQSAYFKQWYAKNKGKRSVPV